MAPVNNIRGEKRDNAIGTTEIHMSLVAITGNCIDID